MTRDRRLPPAPAPRPALSPAARLAVLGAAALASGCMGLGTEAGPQAPSRAGAGEAAELARGEPRPAPRPESLPPEDAEPALAGLPEGASWTDRGARLLDADRPEAAVAAFRRAMAEEGLTPRALIGLGAAHRAQGLVGEAQRILARAASTWPGLPAARNSHGAALYDLGRYASAEAEFRAAADIMTRQGRAPSPEILRNLALAVRARAGEGEADRPAAAAPPAPVS